MSNGHYISRKEADRRLGEDEEFRDMLDKASKDPEFKKFLDAQNERAEELANHPWQKARDIIDAEFELVISYPKNDVPNGHTEVDGKEIPIIESILVDENVEGAMITNDLEIIEITPDVHTVIYAEEAKVNAVWRTADEPTQDYTIHEYIRKV